MMRETKLEFREVRYESLPAGTVRTLEVLSLMLSATGLILAAVIFHLKTPTT